MSIYGTNSADTLFGTSGNDISIFGLDGNDDIYGFVGNDIIDAGKGHDTVYGGPGNDTMLGREGNDLMRGGSGIDAIWGGTGKDTLYGDDGDDYMHGGDGADRLFGGRGNDRMVGGLGDDRLLGVYSRNDVEIDELTGGGGKDTFVLGDYHSNYYNNGGNSDYALIKDFSSIDEIILDQGVYTTGSSPISGVSGTAIYEGAELIAVVQGMRFFERLNFESSGFSTKVTSESTLTIDGPNYGGPFTVSNSLIPKIDVSLLAEL